jgi:hypothetical protein
MFTRRQLLKTSATGFGYLAFAALAHAEATKSDSGKTTAEKNGATAGQPISPKKTHFEPRAKRVLFLCMEGAPSHLDTFDPKPRLREDDGKPAPRGLGGFRGGKLFASPFEFSQRGQSGLWISSLFPQLAKHADKLCMLNGMHTDLPNHAQAFLQMHCGVFQFPRPSLGAWVLYGLGSSNENLPGFVTINPPQTNGGAANYASSFLPAVYQGTRIGRSGGAGEQVSNLKNPQRSRDAQRRQLDFIQQLNHSAGESLGDDAEVEGLISSYELAFRMQGEMPRILDLSQETASTLRQYGIDESRSGAGRAGPARGPFGGFALGGAGGANSFGRQCLVARRLLEAGVRFVEVTLGGWDHHRNLRESLSNSCESIDQPIAALLADLDARGLLQDTLVLWGGEFGRTPHAQGDGRDHNHKGFTMWMAGGGTKRGFAHGKTDEYGYEAVEGRVHMHDWHATILHLLGLDHERLTYRYAGRDMRLTDVKGNVVHEILA